MKSNEPVVTNCPRRALRSLSEWHAREARFRRDFRRFRPGISSRRPATATLADTATRIRLGRRLRAAGGARLPADGGVFVPCATPVGPPPPPPARLCWPLRRPGLGLGGGRRLWAVIFDRGRGPAAGWRMGGTSQPLAPAPSFRHRWYSACAAAAVPPLPIFRFRPSRRCYTMIEILLTR